MKEDDDLKNTLKRYMCLGSTAVTAAMMSIWAAQIIRVLIDFEERNRLYSEVATLQVVSWINVGLLILCLIVGTLVLKIPFEELPCVHWDDYKSDTARKIAGVIHYTVGILLIVVPIPIVIICMIITPHPSEYVSLYGAACIEYEPVDDLLHSSVWLMGANSWICFFSYHSSRYFARMRAVEKGTIENFNEYAKEEILIQQLLNGRQVYADRENKYTLEIIPEYDCGVLKYGESLLGVHFFKEGGTLSICNFYEDNVDYYPQNKNEWLAHGEFAYDGKELKIDINYIEEANTVLKKGIIRFYKNGEKI